MSYSDSLEESVGSRSIESVESSLVVPVFNESETVSLFLDRGRAAGVTKFNGWRLWNFTLEGITSFS